MKRLATLAMALLMMLSLSACGASDEAASPAQDVSEAASVSSAAVANTLVSKEANYTTLLVPDDFGEFSDNNGYAVAQGPNASIIVSPTIEPDIDIQDITAEYMTDLVSDSYSNIEVLALDNPVTIAGVDAVSFVFTGDGASDGANKTVCHLTLFFSIEGQNCEQQVIFTYLTGGNTSLEANLNDIIASITL